MSHICANNTYANYLATTTAHATIAVVVCSTSSPSFLANSSTGIEFYGCGPSPEVCEPGRVWANCTATSSGEYNFTWSDDVYGDTECAIPVVTLNNTVPGGFRVWGQLQWQCQHVVGVRRGGRIRFDAHRILWRRQRDNRTAELRLPVVHARFQRDVGSVPAPERECRNVFWRCDCVFADERGPIAVFVGRMRLG